MILSGQIVANPWITCLPNEPTRYKAAYDDEYDDSQDFDLWGREM